MPSVEMDVQPCLVGAVHPPLSMKRCGVLRLLRLEHDAAVVKEPNAVPLLSMDPPEAVNEVEDDHDQNESGCASMEL